MPHQSYESHHKTFRNLGFRQVALHTWDLPSSSSPWGLHLVPAWYLLCPRNHIHLPRTSPSVFSLGHVVSQAWRRGIRFFSSPDSPSTLVPGGLCHSPPKQTGPSSCGEREGERERRKLSPPTTGRGQRGQASLCPPPLGDPCTPGTLLPQGLARFVNIQLWEEAGLIWWEEGDKEGLVWWNKEGG